MRGFLSVLKPPGMTSHDAVQELRRLTGVRKVGHGGTLDPGAAGVLPVALGKATRLLEFLDGQPKSYRAEMLLGLTTSTQDLEGEVLSCREVPGLAPEQVEEVLRSFLGRYNQVPPMYSAVHYRGRRLYELARAGVEVERQPRTVEIYRLELLRHWPDGPYWHLLLDVTCSGGTYVRTLCADIGEKLGYGGCLAFLVRTAVGPFTLATSHTLEELALAGRERILEELLLPLDFPLAHLPRAEVKPQVVSRILNGNPIPGTAVNWQGKVPESGQAVRLYAPDGAFLAVGCLENPSVLVIRKVLGREEDGRCK